MTLSRKNLKGIAGGIAHQFNSSASSYAYQAVSNSQSQVSIDLLSLAITPSLFNVERNRILARMCQTTLWRNIKQWPDLEIQFTELVANFDLSSINEEGTWVTVVVSLCDERGKKWVGKDHSYTIIDWRERLLAGE